MSYSPTGGYPDLATIRAWIQVPATLLDDEQLGMVAGGEQRAQTVLDWGSTPEAPLDIPDDVRNAFLRRVGRSCAAKGIPLGFIPVDNEYGALRLAKWDYEVDRLEAPYRVPVVA